MRPLVEGSVVGEVIVLDEGLSLWGGFDPATGRVVDRSHPQHGQTLTRKVVYMPHGRGSSSSSTVLAESMRLGTAPNAFILGEADAILVTGSLVGHLLYGVTCPIYVGDVSEMSDGLEELGGV